MQPRAGTINADQVALVERLFGDVVFQLAEKPASDYILPFDLDAPTRAFVGRDKVFAALDDFAAAHGCGYFELVAAAGLGKTALAAEIAKRRGAIAFLTSVSFGTNRAEQFLTHTCAELLTRYDLGRTTLPANASGSAVVLVQFLRDALSRAPGGTIWIIVDGLDEAEPPAPGANPLLLPPDLPSGVRVVVTRRSGFMLTEPTTPVRRYELRGDDPDQAADIEAFIRARAAEDARIGGALRRASPPTTPDAFARDLAERGDGSFMYVRFVLADLADSEPGVIDLRRLPVKLVGYYDELWSRMSALRHDDWDAWERLHRPVLERLAVAAEAVSAGWLAAQVERSADEVEARVLQPWARVLTRSDHRGAAVWRVIHRTFADYLFDSGRVRRVDANLAVAAAYLDRHGRSFDDWDRYGLRHVVTHLADAVNDGHGERESVTRLARLVADPAFLQHRLAVDEPTRVEDDLERVRGIVAASAFPEASLLLVPIAVTLVRLRRVLVKPDAIFAAARSGDVTAAEHLLELLGEELDSNWQSLLALAIAWIAADRAPVQAAALRARTTTRLAADGPPSPPVERLLARVAATQDGTPEPPPALAEPAGEERARAMIERLAGAGIPAVLRRDAAFRAGGGYLSGIDGPPLVALAAADPEVGKPLFERYLDLHGAYGYRQYRSASLWALVPALLEHPDPMWVRDMLARVAVALLGPVRGEFLEGLEIALLTQQALAGDQAAEAALEDRREDALDAAAALPPGTGTASVAGNRGDRGEGDVWAIHRRRLAAFAESAVRLDHGADVAAELVATAMRIVGGYAGFTAAANLTLAESASLVPADGGGVDRARWSLIYALRAAHNIRDPVYCARVTARANAMQARWWPAPDLQRLGNDAAALGRSPASAEFTALHRIGEDYEHRDQDDLPPEMRTADTLRDLAQIYQRPLVLFREVNEPGSDPDDPLPDGTVVNVPDPGFPPLLAARLAAAALAAGGSPDALIRRLVPVAGADPTALGTTLSRLLLATPTGGGAHKEALDELASNALLAEAVRSS